MSMQTRTVLPTAATPTERLSWWLHRAKDEVGDALLAAKAEAHAITLQHLANIAEALADALGEFELKEEERVALSLRNLIQDAADKQEKTDAR